MTSILSSTHLPANSSMAIIPYTPPIANGQLIASAYRYTRLDWRVYQAHLDYTEERVRNQARQMLNNLTEAELASCSIAVTGSDARSEKSNNLLSPLEVILIGNNRSSLEAIAEKMTSIATNSNIFSPHDIETVILDSNSVERNRHTVYYNSPNKNESMFMPVRGLEACYLMGNPEIFQKYKEQFVQDIIDTPDQDYKSFIKKFLIQDSIKQTEKFLSNQSLHGDISNGLLFINDKRIRGTKFALMRTMQYSLAVLVLDKIRQRQLRHTDIQEMPKSICRRLEWLRGQGLLEWMPDSLLLRIQDAYHGALLWHQLAQHAYERNKLEQSQQSEASDSSSPFRFRCPDPDDLRNVSQTIKSFADTFFENYLTPSKISSPAQKTKASPNQKQRPLQAATTASPVSNLFEEIS